MASTIALIKAVGGGSGGGGSDGGALVINITYPGGPGPIVSGDKTPEEVLAAFVAEKAVFFRVAETFQLGGVTFNIGQTFPAVHQNGQCLSVTLGPLSVSPGSASYFYQAKIAYTVGDLPDHPTTMPGAQDQIYMEAAPFVVQTGRA